MNRRLFILLLLFISFSLKCYPQKGNNDSLREIVCRNKQAIVTIPYPGIKAASLLSQKVSVESVKEKKLFIVLSSHTVDWFLNQGYEYTIEKVPETKGLKSAADISEAMEWNTYPTYTQYDSILNRLCTTYPTLCHLDTIGESLNGRLILALKISDNAALDEEEPEVFYSSTIHGNETGGFVMMLRLADYLLNQYNHNQRIRTLVDNLEIFINPLANPDGAYNAGNTILNAVRFNANGVDLNRNFPDPETPSGVHQKETLDMVSYLRKHRFVISANFHSGNEVVNYPWDRWSRLHADDDWFYNVSRKYADTVHLSSEPGYMTFLDNGVTNGYKWYSVYGGRQDFVTYELGGREVTIELDNNFVTPVSELGKLWDNNRASLIGFLENALYGIHGTVKDNLTNEPVEARVFISGHDKDSSHVYSDKFTGNFTRLLTPRLWDLNFSAPGYYLTRKSGVEAVEGKPTFLEVKMVRLTAGVDTTIPGIPFLYPNPSSSEIKAVMPSGFHGSLNIKIVNSAGSIVSDYNTESYPNTPVVISVKRFPSGTYTIVFKNKREGAKCSSQFIVIKN